LASLAGASVPSDRPIDGVVQSGLFLGQTETSAREGILIFVSDRLQALKWRNYKVHFYQQETMVSPPVKLALPLLVNLYVNPREDADKPSLDSWIMGPALRMIAEFEESVKKDPLIPMGTPDPYRPRAGKR
jgi:arylsulfatase